jgi:predicted Zn-dependent protease
VKEKRFVKNFALSSKLGFFALLALLLTFSALPAQAQKRRAKTQEKTPQKQEKPTETPPAPPAGSPLDTVIDIGGDFINSAARLLGGDPYSAFRQAKYTNEGLISEADEIRLATFIDKEVRKRYKVTATGQARLERIGQNIAKNSLRPDLKYRFFVIEDKEINALSIPGGYIYATTGLMNLANDDELASVIGHEVGHVTARHGLKSVKNAQTLGQVAGLLSEAAGVAGRDAQGFGVFASQIVSTGILATHGREHERESDFLGLHFMAKAGYKPEAMITMFQKLGKMKASQPDILGAIFNDHPDVGERISNTAFEIKKMRGE